MTYPQFVTSRCKPGGEILDTLTPMRVHVLHVISKLGSESGELMDAVGKWCSYNKEPDKANIIEELGDIEFYLEAFRGYMGITREETIQANMDKLTKRYPVAYSDKDAQERKDKKV